jgi:hypothetical protein
MAPSSHNVSKAKVLVEPDLLGSAVPDRSALGALALSESVALASLELVARAPWASVVPDRLVLVEPVLSESAALAP